MFPGGTRNTPFKEKDTLLPLAPPTTKRESQHPVGNPSWILKATYSPICMLHYLLWSDPESCLFEGVPEQEMGLKQVQAALQTALPLGTYNQTDPMVVEVVRGRQGCCFKALTDLYTPLP